MLHEPKVAATRWLAFMDELTEIIGGKSQRAPQPGDKRFADPTWTNSALHNRLLKAYLAWGPAVESFVAERA
jgi:polyhydroxyalkanoate synthase